MRYSALLLLFVACSSPKQNIADGARAVLGSASIIEAQSQAGSGEAASLLKNGALPKETKPIVKSMETRFDDIGDEARSIKSKAESIESNLDGVEDKGWSWKTKALFGLGGISILWLAIAGFTRKSAVGMTMSALSWILGLFTRRRNEAS